MSVDIWTDSMQHAELFGKPVLFTNWLIQRDTIPQGWHCYDLRGTYKAPNARITLVDQEVGCFFPNWNLRKMRPWARLAMCEWTSATEEGSSGIAGGLITGTGSISRSLKRCYSDW